MHDQIALVEQLHRNTVKAAATDRAPRIALIDQERQEPTQLALVIAKRRRATVKRR